MAILSKQIQEGGKQLETRQAYWSCSMEITDIKRKRGNQV